MSSILAVSRPMALKTPAAGGTTTIGICSERASTRMLISSNRMKWKTAAVDRPKAAQLWPGDELRFVAVTLEEARALSRARAAALDYFSTKARSIT